ncbi:hypothetical protein Kisp01_29880 [Kineosporia sp. NBRC 101677]|uniref:alpha/beta hydrolase family protein n=1 Tax=Kineosporia sp. NBRC 101677 TaxID=3032197 RepID=UPI0024A380F4|nr:chlorophyllase [Kineosporia sp. NBRC 101677]GLY15973.1 hypothetical protein Kisp01_29880 [Kineosporia sp. NBRC 101677]
MSQTPTAPAIVSVKPVVLPAPERGDDLQVRVAAPIEGENLPVVVFSHGFAQSLDAYAPLADHWAQSGFVVLQPTHLDSSTLAVTPEDPRYPAIWRTRVHDLVRILDDLDTLIAAVPGLAGRVDTGRIAAAGHSWGGQTVGTLLGARVLDDDGRPGEDLSDARVKAGLLLAATGVGDDLTPFAAEHFPFMKPDFSALSTPTLVVAGDKDQSMLSERGPDWFVDPYRLSPGARALLTLFGGEHTLGGIVGVAHTQTTDENPERVALVQRVSVAYLRHELGLDSSEWTTLLQDGVGPNASLEEKK